MALISLGEWIDRFGKDLVSPTSTARRFRHVALRAIGAGAPCPPRAGSGAEPSTFDDDAEPARRLPGRAAPLSHRAPPGNTRKASRSGGGVRRSR